MSVVPEFDYRGWRARLLLSLLLFLLGGAEAQTDDLPEVTVEITGVPSKINSRASFIATFTWSVAVAGFDNRDVTVTGGTKGAFASIDARTYTLEVTPTSGSNVVVTVAANSATDGLTTGPASAVSATATWDATVPTVSITGVPSAINSTTAFTATFTFSEDVTGFATGDVTVTGGTKGAFAGSGNEYTLAVTPTGSADVVVTVAAKSATDGLNTGPASAVSAKAVWDATAPTVEITGVPSKINSTAGLTATFKFSEAVTGFVTGDVTVTGGTKGAFNGSGDEYTLVVTPTNGSDVTVTVAANSATYGSNTGPASAVAATATWDAAAPTVTIGGVPSKINSTAALTATFTFSEAVTGFVTGDVTVTGGTKGAFTGSGDEYTLVVTPAGSANVVVTVAANSATDGLNTGPASTVAATATWDAAAPTVTIGGVPSKINSTAALSAMFTFSEDVTGFATGDVTVTGGTKGAFASTSARTYTLAVTPTSGSNVVVTVAANSATDGVNTGPTSAVSATATWDAAAPAVEIGGVPARINSTAALGVTFMWSDAVTGFITGDVTVTGGTKGAFTGSGDEYTLVVTPTNGSDVTVTVAANSATDGSNTGPASAVAATATWDAAAPTVTIGGVPSKINSTAALGVTFTFSEDVTGFATEDVTVTGGTKGAFASTSARTYTLAVTPTSGSNVVVTVAANSATDGLNTGPASAVSATATWDAAAPAVEIGGVPAKINSTAALGVTFMWSDAVTGFVTGDVTVTGGTKGAFTGSGDEYTLVVTPTNGSDVTVTVAANSATDGSNTGPASAVAATATWDAAAPTVTIGGVPSKINSTAALGVTFTFSEDVTGFATGDVTVTGGTKGAFASTSARTYTLAVTPTSGSNVVVTVAANSATDGVNTGPASAVSATATWDAAAPAVEIGGVPAKINSTAALGVTFMWSDAVTGFVTGDVTVTGGTKGAFTGSGDEYTLVVTPTNGSDVTVTVAANSATDGSNTGPASAVAATATWDAAAPTVTIGGVPSKINSTAALGVTFTFSEDVTGFATGDVTVTGGTKGAFASTSARTYTLAVTPTSGSNVVVTVAANSATDGVNTGPTSAVSATATWDAAAVVLSPTSLDVDEGDDASYTVKLATEATDTVIVAITVPAGTDLTLDDASLTFTTSSWNDAQTVTVTAGEDPDTANDTATLTHTASGGGYGNVEADLAVTVTDDDTVGLVLSPTSLGVAEGDNESYTVKLATEPTNTVTVAISGQSGTDLTLDDASLTFTTSTWNDAQTVTVTAGEDPDTANDTATLTHTASGGGYGNVEADLAVTVTDNDTPGLVLSPTSLTVAEGDDASYTVRLATEPTNTVTVAISGQSGTDLTLDDASLTFTTSTWNDAQTVTVTAGEDPDTANDTATLTHTASGGGYSVAASLAVTVTDNDTLPVVSFALPSSSAREAAGTHNVTVNLSPSPTAATTVSYTVGGSAVAGSDFSISGSGTLSVSSGATTASIPVAIIDDTADESSETVLLELTAGSGYTVGSANSHTLTIVDDDGTLLPTVSLSIAPNPVTEGSAVTVTARLSEVLPSSVTVPLTLTAGTAEAEDYGSLANITVAYGQTTGTGTVSTAQDADEDDETFTVALGTMPSDVTPGSPPSVQVTIRDDDGGGDPPEPPENGPPTVRASCDPCSVAPDGEARLTATASDPDGDRLTYRWSAPAGRFTGPTDRSSARWTAPAETGRVTISVRVSDGEDSVSATVTVEVVNQAPAFEEPVYRFELAENLDGSQQSVHLGRVAAEDPDGDELTYDVSGGDREHFRVGSRDGVVKYVGPGEDYEAEPNRYELTVQAQDPHGAAAEARVVVTVTNVNERPEAEDDAAETPEDEAVTVDVLANDTDPDGDSLRVESVSAPEHGTTRIAAGGGVLYTPEANYHGADRFTYVVTDPEGETASAAVEVTVLSVNDAPAAVGAIPDQPLDEGGGSVDVELAPYFEDVDGDELAYRASSSDTDVATVRVAGAVLTVTPVVYGSAMVTVTAEDPEGLTATQTFTVGVDDRLVRAVLGNTLAAMARSHLASARMTLGRRVEAGGSDESRLTVMGRAVPLGKAAARQAAEQMVMGLLSSGACSGSSAHGLGGTSFGTAGAAPGLGGYPAGGCGGPATGGPALGASAFGGPGLGGPMSGMPPGSTGGLYGFGGFGGGPDALLHGTEFELALGDEEDGGGGWLRRRLSVWGQGDIQTFHGTPTVYRYDARYDGDMRTGYVGVDARLTERWLAGVAVSRSGGRSDWQVGASRGRLKTKLTALHPYAQWSDGTTSVWTMAGGGWGDGEAENVREATGLLGTSTLGLRLGLVELRRELGAVGGGAEFGLRADAAWAELRTGDGREPVDGLAAAVNQQRVGAEVARPLRLGVLGLQPFGAAHLRRDGGAGQTGTGVEVAFGLGLTGGIVRLDVQARTLAVHSAAGYGERGAGLTLTVGGQKREGLSLSVSPTWGDAASGTGALWQEEVYRHYLPEKEQDTFAVDARGDYGMRLPNGGLLTWFGSYSHSPYGRGFLVGGSIGGLADALLPGR